MYKKKNDFQQDAKEDKTMDVQRRRKALKVMASAGVLSVPAYWSKPVVDGVLLPAHAQTSGVVGLGLFAGAGSITTNLTTPV